MPCARMCRLHMDRDGAHLRTDSYLGATGIQVLSPYWNLLYTGVAERNEYDQVLFYEFGRNF